MNYTHPFVTKNFVLCLFFSLLLQTICLSQGVDQDKKDKKEKTSQDYYTLVQLGYIIHTAPWKEPGRQIDPYTLSLQSSIGIRSVHYGLGLGAGINLFRTGYVVPVFLDLRGKFLKKKISPTYYCQLGTSIPLYNESSEDWWGPQNFKASGGILLDTGLGVSISSSENFDWLFTLGYRSQEITESYFLGGTSYRDEYVFRRISFQVGLVF